MGKGGEERGGHAALVCARERVLTDSNGRPKVAAGSCCGMPSERCRMANWAAALLMESMTSRARRSLSLELIPLNEGGPLQPRWLLSLVWEESQRGFEIPDSSDCDWDVSLFAWAMINSHFVVEPQILCYI